MVRRVSATLLCLALILQTTPPTLAAPTGLTAADPPRVQEVDPFIGTAGEGNTFPGAAAPFGMLQWSPDTTDTPGGYAFNDRFIQDFSLTHLSGAGCMAYQDIPILPTVQPLSLSPGTHWFSYSSAFAHVNESASAGHYAVRLEPAGIQVDLTVTRRTGMGRFRFPSTASANVLFNVSGSGLSVSDAAVEIVGSDLVTGWVSAGGFCGGEHAYTLYFVAQFDRPFSDFGTWTEDTVSPGERAAASERAASPSGAYVTFDTRRDPAVQLKVGVSFVSLANALGNLQKENPGWDLAAIRAATVAAWEEELGCIEVEGGSAAQRKIFYTALYHALLHPNVFSDANGEYLGFDDQVHVAEGYEHYANFSGWDIYRSEVPLLAWLVPRQTSDMLNSLVVDAQQGGALPRWPLANDETGTTIGDPSALIIANGYAFGADRFDLQAAFQAMRWGAEWVGARSRQHEIRPGLRDDLARGYVPLGAEGVRGAAAATLEYASADFAIARLAESLGDPSARARYMQRAQSWQQLFNASTGFIHPRTASGVFLPGFEPDAGKPSPLGEQTGFLEGNTWQYTWMVPFNLRALIAALGGPAEATRRLDAFFGELNAGPTSPHAWMGNEPSFGVPWVYAFAGAPSRMQAVVRRIQTELFRATPDGLPGNDDLGATSAWYVWAALGLYPAIPAVGGFIVGSPLFPTVTVHTGRGQRLKIVGQGAADAASPYVRNLRLNGRPYARIWLPLDAFGGDTPNLSFTLGPKPETWGSGPDDAPPSFSEGEVPAIGFTNSDQEEVKLLPGSSQRFTLGVRNVTAETRAVQWSATPPTGMQLEPAQGVLELEGGADATVELTIAASGEAAPGCNLLVLALQGVPDGASAPGPVVGVSVPRADTSEAPVCE